MNFQRLLITLMATLFLTAPLSLAAEASSDDDSILSVATLAQLFGSEPASPSAAPDDSEAQGCGGVSCGLFGSCGCWEQCVITVCTGCGEIGEPACLDGDEPRPCRVNFVQETAGICATCGFTGSVACLDGDDPSACRSDWTQEVAGICVACGGVGQPTCLDGENPVCRPFLNGIGGICTPCGGDLQPVCLEGPQCAPRNQSLTGIECLACGGPRQPACFNESAKCDQPHPNDAYAGFCLPDTCGGDQQLTCETPGVPRCDAGLTVWESDPIRPVLEDNLINPALTGLGGIISILEVFGFDVDGAIANTDYCVNDQPTDFALDNPADNWPADPAPRGARTVFLIHGLGGGGYGETDEGGFALVPPQLQSFAPYNRLIYSVDYNSVANVDENGNFYPMRVFAQDAAGNAQVVYSGSTPIDGTNITFRNVADFIRDAAVRLPVEGKVMLVGVSLGGYVTKELVHRHYDELRYRGREIVQVNFFGHPHFGFLMDPLDGEVAACSSLAPLGNAVGFNDASLAQLCTANRWLHGWDDATAFRIDEADYPQIRWGNSWGETGAGDFLVPPFAEELLGIDPTLLQGDGTVPSDSARGADVLNSFVLNQVAFDLNVGGGCGHTEFDCYLADIDSADPMHFTDDALCGDFDFSAAALDDQDVLALQQHLAGSVPFSAQQFDRCDVTGTDGTCSILDATVLALATAQTVGGDPAPRPPGVQQLCAGADDLTDKLVGYWSFDENAGTTAANGADTCSRFDANLVGGASWQPGIVGAGSLALSGSATFAGISDPVALQALEGHTQLSFATWVYPVGPGSSSAGGILVNKEGEYEIARFPDGSIQWAISPQWTWTDTTAVAPLGTWTHFALTLNELTGEVRSYQNGVLVSVAPFAGPIGDRHPESPQFRLGGRTNANQFLQGQLDESAFWHRALNEREVAALYNNGAGLSLAGQQVCAQN